MQYRILLSIIVTVFFSFEIFSQNQHIKPGEIWYDTDGHPINAHAGCVIYHQQKYYWFGQVMIAGYKGNDAWVGVSCYSSGDLMKWEYEGIVLQANDQPSHLLTRGCKIERPNVLYNDKTGKFVMWFHHDIKGQGHSNALTGIAVSDNITGPYQFIRSFRPLSGFWPINISDDMKESEPDSLAIHHNFNGASVPKHPDSLNIIKRDFHTGQMARDMALFKDEDGKAYHVYSSEENSTIHIAELSDDYMGHTGKYIRVFPGRFMEAPVIFKHNGKYHFMASGCTSWTHNAMRSAVADDIWGPWKELGNPCLGKGKETSFESQGTYAFKVEGKEDAFVFMADRWKPERFDNSRYLWLPVIFDKDGSVRLEYFDNWNLSVFEKRNNNLTAPKTIILKDTLGIRWSTIENADGYRVYENGKYVYFTTKNKFLVKNKLAGRTYKYAVQAIDLQGNVSPISSTSDIYVGDPKNVYLSDIEEEYANQSYNALKKDISVSGNPIKINGEIFKKGLGTHADSEIIYILSGQYDQFQAKIGIDDFVKRAKTSSARFKVYCDNKLVFESKTMDENTPAEEINIDVTDVNELKLVVDGRDSFDYDHANWAGAKLIVK